MDEDEQTGTGERDGYRGAGRDLEAAVQAVLDEIERSGFISPRAQVMIEALEHGQRIDLILECGERMLDVVRRYASIHAKAGRS